MDYQVVRVLINQAKFHFKNEGYVEGHPLKQAIQFVVEHGMTDVEICAETFRQLNMPLATGFGNLTRSKIGVYHKVFPSLSVADVVEVDGRRYAIEAVDLRRLSDTRGLGQCSLCEQTRELTAYGPDHALCADCMQGDPMEDLGLYESIDETKPLVTR